MDINEKQEALSLLSQTATAIYNIEGDKWQMAFEVLESLYCYLKAEVAKDTTHADI